MIPNGSELHLALVHFPVALTIVSVILLIVAMATRRPERLKFVFELMVLGAVFSFAAHQTGDMAHEFLENYLGAAHEKIMPLITDHMNWADYANMAMIAGGLVGLIGWFFSRDPQKFRMGLAIIALAVMGTSTALVVVTAKKGGLIRHPEINAPAATDADSPTSNTEKSEMKPTTGDNASPTKTTGDSDDH